MKKRLDRNVKVWYTTYYIEYEGWLSTLTDNVNQLVHSYIALTSTN